MGALRIGSERATPFSKPFQRPVAFLHRYKCIPLLAFGILLSQINGLRQHLLDITNVFYGKILRLNGIYENAGNYDKT
ncbi:hypothetical protein [Nitrosomonas sp.]|uniref:hypothetical protein n=1 Tax=Nitrosomonas sp. TaxID=42353 RepID=UPI00260A3BF8|nr:hypothetical protein [Nitrosomonas sp.]